ncbi:hypothetical protein JHK87_009798 [Glycine soja]|nr:hypothetical protein JHK87_009798 [Glycine soja]
MNRCTRTVTLHLAPLNTSLGRGIVVVENRMIERGCGVRVLAGVVMWETLLLKLCLAFEKGIGRVEQEKKLMAFAVQTTTHSPTGPTSPWMEALVLGT